MFEQSTDAKYVCMHELALFGTLHHTLVLNWGNWLNKEQILQLINSAWRIQLTE